MSFPAVLAIAAAATTVGAVPAAQERGIQLAAAQVHAVILRPAIVRQASGVQEDREGPAPQITRRGRTVLAEYQ